MWRGSRRLTNGYDRHVGCNRLAAAVIATVALASAACGGGQHGKWGNSDGDQIEDKRLDQARVAAKKHDFDTAAALYEKVRKDHPVIAVLNEQVRFLISAGRANDAVTLAKAYYDEKADDAKGFRLYADALIADGQSAAALEVTDQMIQLDAGDIAAHEQRGRALTLADRFDDAVTELNRAAQLDAHNADVMMSLGIALQKDGKIDEAIGEFRAAVNRMPDSSRANRLLGAALGEKGSSDEAKVYLLKAIQLDPDDGHPLFELGILYNRLQDQASAEDDLAKATKLSPGDSTIWYAYGEILRIEGKIEPALAAYRHAIELTPAHPKAALKLGTALIDAGRAAEAETVLTEAVRRDPNNAANYAILGHAYAKDKKNALAIDAYDKFLQLAPKDDAERAKVKKALADVKKH